MTELDILKTDLSVNEKMVYIVLTRFEETEFPSISTLAELASLSRSTVIRALNALEEKGYIRKELRFEHVPEAKAPRQTTNAYRILKREGLQ